MTRSSPYRLGGKRALDLLASTMALVLAAPILLLVVLVLLALQGRPVFFVQQRPGFRGVPFGIIKFRTMTPAALGSAEETPDEVRLTRVGRFLRSTSLDELPELLNVLKGDMSLVGPRPLLMRYLPLYSAEQARRHSVKPGITGWAQINGRNALTWERKFEFDVWYVDHLSLALDVQIVGRTMVNVIRRQGVNFQTESSMPYFEGSAQDARGAAGAAPDGETRLEKEAEP